MRIAVIGSGISGLTAAHLLAPHSRVTLYEKEHRLGGHANTALIEHSGKKVPVDTGFMVFNPDRYPYFFSLVQSLGVETQDTNMGFSVSIPGEVEYSGSIPGIFGNLQQLLRPAYLRCIGQIPRFNTIARDFLKHPTDACTMGEFLRRHKFSQELAAWYVFPMIGSIWSTDVKDIDTFPARETLRFLDNHQLLSIIGGPQWKTIKGGSVRYVEALSNTLRQDGVEILFNQRIKRITRSPVQIHTDTIETFDAIILALHADDACTLLADKNQLEIDILGSFSYARNTAVVHNDTSFMPQRKSVWSAWNYHSTDKAKKNNLVSLTYNMNLLQHIPNTFPVMVTLNPQKMIPPAAIFATYEYEHPVVNISARRAQQRLALIQGNRDTYFAGAHWGNGFHEDGVVSAIEAVRALNFPIRISL